MRTHLTFKINLDSNEDSNLFLRKLWQEIYGYLDCSIQPFPVKISEKNIVVVGIIAFKDHSIGIKIRYKKRGCIDQLYFNDVPSNYKTAIDLAVEKAKQKYSNSLVTMPLAYGFAADRHYIEEFEADAFKIEVTDDYRNSLSVTGNGYDPHDAFTFTQYKADTVINLLSIYFMIPFDHKGSYTMRNRRNLRLLVEDIPIEKRYEVLKVDKEFPFLLEKALKLVETNPDATIFRAARLIKDGLMLEKHGMNSLSINFKETAHTLYMSAFEVLSSDLGKSEKCENCGQQQYKISKKLRDLIYEVTKSKKLAGSIIKDYGMRSKYLHEGHYFSPNNLLHGYLPQISKNSDTGHILQINFPDSLHNLKMVLRLVALKRLEEAVTES